MWVIGTQRDDGRRLFASADDLVPDFWNWNRRFVGTPKFS